MLERTSQRRDNVQTVRSQLATELLLNAFTIVAVVILFPLGIVATGGASRR